MDDSSENIEGRILQACEAAKREKNPNIAALARKFRVPASRLRSRFNGRQPRTARPSTNNRLDKAQEDALVSWIAYLDDIGVLPTPKAIQLSANTMVQRVADASDAEPLNKMWAYNFLKRLLPQYSLVKQKPMDKKRIEAEDIGILQHWYDMLEPTIAKTPLSNIYNFDETGFQLGQGKSEKVVTRHRYRSSRIIASEHGENLTAIECVAADGWVMSPYFIARGEYFLERWFDPKLPDDYLINVSPKGYTDDQIALDWLEWFNARTFDRVKWGQPRVLLFDGYGSHLTIDFLAYCKKKHIIPICFIPHTTHIVQPLDGNLFLAYKTYFREKNNEIIR